MRIRNKNTDAVLQIVEVSPTKDDSYVIRTKDEEGRQLILSLADLMRDFEPVVPQEFEDPNVKVAEHLAGPLTEAIREVEAGRMSVIHPKRSTIKMLAKKILEEVA